MLNLTATLRGGALIALLLFVLTSCNGASGGDADGFTPTASGTEFEDGSGSPLPGYGDGAVPWEQAEGAVPVILRPQDSVDEGGKSVRSLRSLPFSLPQPGQRQGAAQAESLANDYYQSFGVERSEVQGVVFDAASGSAWAMYELALPADAPLSVGIAFYALPQDFSACYVGIADRSRSSWEWFSAPDDGVLSFADDSERLKYVAGGTICVCVALEAGQSADLWKLRAGVPELRGTGLLAGGEEAAAAAELQGTEGKQASALPASVDLNSWYPAIRNQGSMGSCTAFAVNDTTFNIMLAQLYGGSGWNTGSGDFAVSPMYSYIKSGVAPIGNWLPICGASSGRYMSQAFNVLKDIGTATEGSVPYVSSNNCVDQFPGEAASEAALLRITSWHSIGGNGDSFVAAIKTQLATHQRPVPLALYGLEDAFLSYSGGVYQYQGTAGYNAGHAVAITGYDDSLQAFRVRNSWGSYWGDDGYIWFGYNAAKSLKDLGRFIPYYMVVEANPDALSYFLGSAPQLDESEPNNGSSSANSLPTMPFSTWTGSLGGTDTADYLSFSHGSGFSTAFSISYSGASAPSIELLSAGGSVLASSSSGASPRSLSGYWTSAGSAFLRITASGDCDYVVSGSASQPPASPTGFSASTGAHSSHVQLNWNHVAGSDSYRIERASSIDGSYQLISSAVSDSYSDYAVAGWGHYFYRVSSVKAGLAGPPTGVVEGWPSYPRPASMSASNGSYDDRVQVSWASVAGATGYRLSRSLNAQGPFSPLGEHSSSPAADYTAQPGITYYYQICALKDGRIGPPSDTDTGYAGGSQRAEQLAGDDADAEALELVQDSSGDSGAKRNIGRGDNPTISR